MKAIAVNEHARRTAMHALLRRALTEIEKPPREAGKHLRPPSIAQPRNRKDRAGIRRAHARDGSFVIRDLDLVELFRAVIKQSPVDVHDDPFRLFNSLRFQEELRAEPVAREAANTFFSS